MNLPQRLALLLAAVLLAAPVRASSDDYLGEIEREEYDLSEKMTKAQKEAAKAAEKAAKAAAKIAEKAAKAAAKAAKNAAKSLPRPQRDAAEAQGKFLVEQAKLTEETSKLEGLASLATSAGYSLESIPEPDDFLEIMLERAQEAKLFYDLMVTSTPEARVTAVAARAAYLATEAAEQAAFLSGLNELQVKVFKASAEVAEEIVDVAEAKAEWDDKVALAALSPTDYATEIAARKAAKAAAEASLAALDLATREWEKRSRETAEDIAEIEDAILYEDTL